MTTNQKIYLIASLFFMAYLFLIARGYRLMLAAVCAENAQLKKTQTMTGAPIINTGVKVPGKI
jgi:hypothetical protein